MQVSIEMSVATVALDAQLGLVSLLDHRQTLDLRFAGFWFVAAVSSDCQLLML